MSAQDRAEKLRESRRLMERTEALMDKYWPPESRRGPERIYADDDPILEPMTIPEEDLTPMHKRVSGAFERMFLMEGNPNAAYQFEVTAKPNTPNLREIVRRSVGLK